MIFGVRKVRDTDFFVGVLYNMNNTPNKTIKKLIKDVNKLKNIVKKIPVSYLTLPLRTRSGIMYGNKRTSIPPPKRR